MTSGPNANEDPDTEGATVPPYEGRRKAADVDGSDETEDDGAHTGGATGPVEDDSSKVENPAATEGGQHAAPADEQPADASTDTDTDPDVTGPAHEPGEKRAEDQS
jgi:hypothetical protein